ncbi:MAG: phosphoglycerate mutase family protein [Candidatus Omnitrophica bacterium]|jgi:broad specificity phosphatase PhoE|nr:phosphoglycerate mutase family protein [Candidatus Omnitrophota bacterium]
MNTKICFIRHAESESNAGGRTSDPATIPLSKQGIAQAEALALTLSDKPALAVTSRYIRTKQTALPVIKKFKDVLQEEWDVHEFTYLSPAKCENTISADRLPMVHAYWQKCDPFYCDGLGAESFVDFLGRARRAIEKLKRLNHKNVAIFSHEQFIKAVIWLMGSGRNPIDSEKMKAFKQVLLIDRIPNCGKVTIFL